LKMSKPVAVLISDIHYNINTLEVADAALRQAVDKANELEVPLVIAGDLHDTKANLRGECVQAMLETISRCDLDPYILVGNHDLINERSYNNSLEFLRNSASLVRNTCNSLNLKAWLIPYHSDVELLRERLKQIPAGSTLIMHQGLNGSESGEYMQDKSALEFYDVKDFRVISGHYHRRQDIKTGRPRQGALGLFSYIGNPFTLSFGEANDPAKGFQILMDNGLLEFIPTNLRQHHIYEIEAKDVGVRPTVAYNPNDLVWIKISGSKEELLSMTKTKVAEALSLNRDFRLELIQNEATPLNKTIKALNNDELLDTLIDSLASTSDERKTRLKELWRKSVCG
jgi:DNA repair exonuclease SbcCD nuclease subunit